MKITQASKNSPFDLSGKSILISGAAGGIGSATARLCADQGASLVLIDLVAPSLIRERVGETAAGVAELACGATLHGPRAQEAGAAMPVDHASSHGPRSGSA